jgi:transcriptional regulator with XRE-family HTH domain
MDLNKINIKIRNRRIELGYNSAEQFAFDNKINRSTYQRVEQGKNMTLDTLVKVAQALKIEIKELL